MSYPDCQYSHVSWIAKDSLTFKALMEGLKKPATAPGAVATFLTTLTTAHTAFKKGLQPGADLSKLLKAYQDTTGVISTREFALPDIPDDPGHPGNSGFDIDLIEGIAGAAMTEIGVGISLYTLVMDLVTLFNIKLHLQGLLMNTADTDLGNLYFMFGPNGQPNILPLARTIPAAKKIMNPLDKQNYDCVGFTLFGGVGEQSLQGFYVVVDAQRKTTSVQMYCQFYASYKGVAPGRSDRDHEELRDVYQDGPTVAVMVDQPGNPNGMVAIVCG